jgi:hypothetical protein
MYCALAPWLKVSCPCGAEAVCAAYRFCEITASVRRFEERAVFEEIFEEIRGDPVQFWGQ